MTKILSLLNEFLWGIPALLLILSVGLYLSIRLGFVQLTLLPKALKHFFAQLVSCPDKSGFRALCTALAATVGTGNLVGVAGAICLGGPGSVFWMWLCGFLGMVTKYTEAALAVRYRIQTEDGFQGGPMYVMERGLGKNWKPMAVCYSLFGLIASFGVGNAAQINAVVTGIRGILPNISVLFLGLVLATAIGALMFGGAESIGRTAEILVPFAAAGYIVLCCGVLILRMEAIPKAFSDIVQGAFAPGAVTGGMLGSGFRALCIGCSRGVFTNEAGMGTAAIAHGGADVAHPVQQGLMGIVEVFLDTIVICTLTALVILVSGMDIPYGIDLGAELTQKAFASVYGDAAPVFLAFALCLFAVATVLGWGLYGSRCVRYLFGSRACRIYAAAQTLMVLAGAVLDTGLVWQFSEAVNGLMVIPNLITLALLSPEVVRLTKEYKESGD